MMIASTAASPPARADVIPYRLSYFALLNANADGTVTSPDGGVSATLTGGNNGSGLGGRTDLLATAMGPGTIEFNYIYSSLDLPGFDWAGYVVGDVFTQLADTNGQSGTASFAVAAGQTFGFRVETFDNTQEPGVFTISAFPAEAPSTVPEPATGQLVVAAVCVIAAALARRRYVNRIEEKRS